MNINLQTVQAFKAARDAEKTAKNELAIAAQKHSELRGKLVSLVEAPMNALGFKFNRGEIANSVRVYKEQKWSADTGNYRYDADAQTFDIVGDANGLNEFLEFCTNALNANASDMRAKTSQFNAAALIISAAVNNAS